MEVTAMMIGAMPMPPAFKYRDVCARGMPGHDAGFLLRHPPMPVSRWAKIFAPFDALRGFDEAIESAELLSAGGRDPALSGPVSGEEWP